MRLDLIRERGIEIVGDTAWRGVCDVEDAELVTYFNQLNKLLPQVRACALHIPNEKKRNHGQLQIDRAKGSLNTGASDIVVPGFPTLIIELKRQDHTESSISSDQLDYLAAAQKLDCWVCVALGWRAALDFTVRWYDTNYEKV